jgi:SAM-dependent methyltransferase
MKQNRLYNDLAWTWPIISPPSDYVEDADKTRGFLLKHSKIAIKTLLNLGCGGGHDDFGLKRYFAITGIDLSPAMLELARKLNPQVTYLEGDMRTMRLDKSFDAVFLGDAVNYMLTREDLAAAFRTAYAHLKPGGAFITFVEQTPETFVQNKTKVAAHKKGDVEIVFIENLYDPDPSDTTCEDTFVYLIRRGGKQQVEVDHHVSGIFGLQTWLDLMTEAGFTGISKTVEEYPDYPQLYTLVGIKPLEPE